MAKQAEIDYIGKVAEVDHVDVAQFRDYLARKPFSDARCAGYLMDIAQVMGLLPPAPARVLDIGVGSGWTSELFARRGYEVLGLDIAPDMIELARQRVCPGLRFDVWDYENDGMPQGFDAVVIYDALHHAEDPAAVVGNAWRCLNEGGLLITMEPGAGHSTSAESIEVMRKYGTTEKDMPESLQRELMVQAGFGEIRQYVRASLLPLEDVASLPGVLQQSRHAVSLAYQTSIGLSSVVVAVKRPRPPSELPGRQQRAEALLKLAALHDEAAMRALDAAGVPQPVMARLVARHRANPWLRKAAALARRLGLRRGLV